MIPWYRNPILTFLIGWVVGIITWFVFGLIVVGSVEHPPIARKMEDV